ncbi:MAG: hypothetical protein P4L69_10410 [Desulfosporosinus sp.]|nr:hypothetical protein [Desulfosporosinus sp.]
MVVQNNELLKVWSWRFSVGTAVIVVLLSWLNGVEIPDLMIRAGISFGVMYFLMNGAISLFKRMALQTPQEKQPSSPSGRGGHIDVSLGEEELQKPEVPDAKFAGQLDQDLSSGLPDSERQAEIVRRMGWE